MIPNSATKTFVDIYEDVNTFEDDYDTITAFQSNEIAPVTQGVTNYANIDKIYYMLYAKYGNSPITNYDENQFKYKLFMTIWQYAPAWLRRLDVQEKLRAISNDDLVKGAKVIYNHAYNPSTEPATDAETALNYINDQNTTNFKKSKMDAYTQLWSILVSDVTEEFMARFKPLFKKFVSPYTELYEGEN